MFGRKRWKIEVREVSRNLVGRFEATIFDRRRSTLWTVGGKTEQDAIRAANEYIDSRLLEEDRRRNPTVVWRD